MIGACSMHREMIYAYRILVGKHEGKLHLGRGKHRWENNIKKYLNNWV
jgi:hypothetical protein